MVSIDQRHSAVKREEVSARAAIHGEGYDAAHSRLCAASTLTLGGDKASLYEVAIAHFCKGNHICLKW
jgi:hypothetical protein